MLKRCVLLPMLAVVTSSGLAAAQDEPTGLIQKQTATTGTTDVASVGFEATAVPLEEANDTTELSLNAGAFLSSGNSRSLAATFAEQFRLRRTVHQFSLTSSVNYGRSAVAEGELETTVENYQARARYDHFVTGRFALFLGVSARKDRFQGLAVRLNVAPGAAFYFVDAPEQQFWVELGYNLQHDVRTNEVIQTTLDDTGRVLDDSDTRHFGRAFIGYNNKLNESVVFQTGFEYLLGISPFEDEETGSKNWRLSWTAGLNAKVSDKFSVATSIGIDHDNNPLPGVRRTDANTAINLVYSLL